MCLLVVMPVLDCPVNAQIVVPEGHLPAGRELRDTNGQRLPSEEAIVWPHERRDPIADWNGDQNLRQQAERMYALWADREQNPEKLRAYAGNLRQDFLEERVNNIYYAAEALSVAAKHEAYDFWQIMPNGRYDSPHVDKFGLFYAAIYHYDVHATESPIQKVADDVLIWVEDGNDEHAEWEYHEYYVARHTLNRPDLLFRMSRQTSMRAMELFLELFRHEDTGMGIAEEELAKLAALVRAADDEVWRNRFGILPTGKKDEAREAISELATYGLPRDEAAVDEKAKADDPPRWWVRLFALHMMARHLDDLGSIKLLDRLQQDPYTKLRTEARLLNDEIRGALDDSDDAPVRPWEVEP